MQSVHGLPNSNFEVFAYTGGAPVVWEKPVSATFVYGIVIGGGGGGGAGHADSAGTDRAGGGGGGSGGVTRFLILASLFPERVYMYPGAGGAGAAPSSGLAGSDGNVSSIRVFPDTSQNATIFVDANGGGGGGAGSAVAGGTAGAAAAQSTIKNFGLITVTAGRAGAAGGGITATGQFVTWGSTVPVTGGCGGAGVNAAGTVRAGAGVVSPVTAWFPSSVAPGAGGNGEAGRWFWGPTVFGGFGGGAGGSSNSGGGGTGGAGGYGCGGGGGSGGVVGGGGGGGNGGSGLIIVGVF